MNLRPVKQSSLFCSDMHVEYKKPYWCVTAFPFYVPQFSDTITGRT